MALPLPVALGALPALPLLLLIAWSGVQPRLLPPWAAFLLGILFDMVAGQPLGVFGTVFLLVRVMAGLALTRAASRSMLEEWLVAAGLVLLGGGLQLACLLVAGRAIAPAATLVQAAISTLFYPAILAIVARLNQRLLKA
jgi:rod shape-determining protein MreD